MVEEASPVDPNTAASNTAFLAEMERKRAAQNKAPAPEEYVIPPQPRWKQRISADYGTAQSGIVGFLLRHGLAKNEQQANVILIGVLVAAVVLTAWVLWPSGSRSRTSSKPIMLTVPGVPSPTTQTVPTQ